MKNFLSGEISSVRRSVWVFRLWLVVAILVALIVIVIGTAAVVRQAMKGGSHLSPTQSRIVLAVAEFPSLVLSSVNEVRSWFGGVSTLLLIDRATAEQPGWVRRFPAPEDKGYLLFSGMDAAAKHSTIQLIRISDGAVVARWDPDWSMIYEKITDINKGNPQAARAFHPLLLADGDIIFNTGNSLVRQGVCSRVPVWVLSEGASHSNELDMAGMLWVPTVTHDGYSENAWLQQNIQDSALAHVTVDGVVLERRSFARILRNNGLEAMLLGTFGPRLNPDPIHLNQISVAREDSKYWKKGDLLISARHLSALFLYRPSSDKIIWYKAGPWLNQHSAEFVDNHRISVLNNNVISGVTINNAFMTHDETNQVLVYDFDTQQVTQPFAALLAKARPVTITEGRAHLLPDGGLFFEETNYGRDMRFTKDHLLWSRVNDYDEQHIGMVSWSRYLTAEEVGLPLQALAAKKCERTGVIK